MAVKHTTTSTGAGMSPSGATAWDENHTIDANTVTLAMQANIAADSLVYRKTAGAGPPEVQTLATLKTDLGLTGTNSGDNSTMTATVGGLVPTPPNVGTQYLNGLGVFSTPPDTNTTYSAMTATVGGLVPTPPNNATQFLNGTGTFSTVPAAPAGTDKQVQFNDGGALAGDPDLIFDKTNNHLELGLGGGQGAICLASNAADEVAEAGGLVLYAKNIGGRVMPKWIGPSGIDTPFQPFFGFNKIITAQPAASGTTVTTFFAAFPPGAITSAGTAAQVTMGAGSTVKARARWCSFASGTTAGNMATNITPNYEAKIAGGFFYSIRFGASGTIQSGERAFFGLWASTTATTNVDLAAAGTAARIGIGWSLAGTAGNLTIYAGTGAAAFTPVDLGSTDFAVNNSNIFEFVMFCAPGASSITYRVTNLETAAQTTGSISGNIPTSTTLLAVQNWVTNNATAAAAAMVINKWYLETDY